MPRTNLALATDVVRRFNPQVTESNLEDWQSSPEEAIIGYEDVDQIESRIEGVESKWDRQAQPMREARVGSTDAYVYKSAKGRGFPIHVYLDHSNVAPIDSAEGDEIWRRTGRDSWTDITGEEGSSWVADYRKGKLTVYELPGAGSLPVLRNFRDRFVRLTYRVGAGGDFANAGETTLPNGLSTGADKSGVSVADASRLPSGGGTMLVGGAEYVEVTAVDHSADTIDVGARGIRATSDTNHANDATIHYCPMNVREAVAAEAARELVLYDDWTDELVDTGNGAPQPQAKLDAWEDEWNNAVARYAGGYGYK